MGESICLVRSFSQPAEFSSHQINNEVVPNRVLTESVSFGRFANETLAWERWSAFTQNRYLEEVERFTKPGSVAQKKAFFEAHFKNRASGRVTQAKKIEEVKTGDEIVCEVPKDILVDSEVTLVVSNGEVDETTDVKTDEVENLKSVVVLDEENSTSLSEERPPSCSESKVSSSKLEPSVVIELNHSLKNTRKESSSSSTRSLSVSKNRSRSPAQPVHMSISCAPSGNTDKKIVGMPQNGAKSAGKADKKKRSGPSSVHMSLNFASSARHTTKAVSKTLVRNSTTQETTSSNARNKVFPKTNEPTGASKIRKRPFSQTSKEGFKAAKCSTSASAVTLPELPPLSNQLSENKRKNITVGKSISCRIPNNVQRKPPVSCENLSIHSRTKAKSSTVSSPFIFRSDERAEKRKEFFKKVEEKNKKENTGKDTFSCGFKANQNTHLASKEHKNPQVAGLQVPPITLTSPRFRKNRTPGKENITKSHQTPRKASSMKIINTKKVMEKLKSCKIHPSSKSQTNIKTQENMSPNILQN
ncbi:TPX2 C-terminal [Arabidopsis suecica]|uniref:TPX2 C-terminal n=1 Tax=Arabidopsis suecica TaxID=45249 RepID=A0A8T1ZS40_ARASU|nr:TPX2 C-terminal [Arabidopsis suecica]